MLQNFSPIRKSSSLHDTCLSSDSTIWRGRKNLHNNGLATQIGDLTSAVRVPLIVAVM